MQRECIEAFNDLKLNKKYKYIIYKLSDDFADIVVEHSSETADWEAFRELMLSSVTQFRVRFPGFPFLLCAER